MTDDGKWLLDSRLFYHIMFSFFVVLRCYKYHAAMFYHWIFMRFCCIVDWNQYKRIQSRRESAIHKLDRLSSVIFNKFKLLVKSRCSNTIIRSLDSIALLYDCSTHIYYITQLLTKENSKVNRRNSGCKYITSRYFSIHPTISIHAVHIY